MNTSNSIGLSILVIIVSLALIFYLKRAREIYRDHDRPQTPPILKLLLSGVLVLVSAIGFLIHSPPLWLHLLRLFALYYALLLSYSANIWLLTGKKHYLVRSNLFRGTTAIAIAVGVLGYLTRTNLGSIITHEPFQRTLVYYAHFGVHSALLLCLLVRIVQLFWQSIRQAKDVSYIVRRSVGLFAFLAATFAVGTTILNLVLSMFYGDRYRHELNQVFTVVLPFAGLLPLMNVVPQAYLVKALQPLERYLARRAERQHVLLRYLHQQMLQVVPRVHLPREQLRDVRTLEEISGARRIIWSHKHHGGVLTPKEEADHLFALLQTQTVLDTLGPYRPPTTRQRNIVGYNLAVARYLQRLEAQAQTNGRLTYDP